MGQAWHFGWGLVNPAGHVVLSFPTALQAARAARALAGIGLDGRSVQRLSDRQMCERLDDELGRVPALAALCAEIAFARDHRRRAERGCHWLVVRASNDGRACQVADCVRTIGAATARYYSHVVVQELFDALAAPSDADAGRDAFGLPAAVPAAAGRDTSRIAGRAGR